MKWAIKAKQLYDGTRTPPVKDAIVVIEDGKVSYAGPRTKARLEPDVEVMDAGDRTVMPGMIDAHVHIVASGSASSGREQYGATEGQALLQATRNAQLALASGLTSIRDCGDRDFLTLTLRDYISGENIVGPRLFCSGPPITSTGGQSWRKGFECDSADELRKAVRTLVKKGVDHIKFMGSGGNATPGSNPEASQFDAEAFKVVADDAHRMGKIVVVHVHGVESTRYAVDAGMENLEHCPMRVGGTARFDPRIAEDIVRKGLYIGISMPATWYRMRAEEMAEPRMHPGHLWGPRIEVIRKQYEAGIKMVVSSDQGSTGTRIDELWMLMSHLVQKVGIAPLDVLYGVTGLAAESMGMRDQFGTLEAGRLADVVILDGDPFTDIEATRRVHKVIKGGEVVVADGALKV